MSKAVNDYKGMTITLVTNAPLNNMFNVEEIYVARKLDFSQPTNYLTLMGKTLERCKENIDHCSQHGKQKFVF